MGTRLQHCFQSAGWSKVIFTDFLRVPALQKKGSDFKGEMKFLSNGRAGNRQSVEQVQ